MIYSFDLSDFEEGCFTATRYPDGCAVGGDWVCRAPSDRAALRRARRAAQEDWCAPETRDPLAFRVRWVDSYAVQRREEV